RRLAIVAPWIVADDQEDYAGREDGGADAQSDPPDGVTPADRRVVLSQLEIGRLAVLDVQREVPARVVALATRERLLLEVVEFLLRLVLLPLVVDEEPDPGACDEGARAGADDAQGAVRLRLAHVRGARLRCRLEIDAHFGLPPGREIDVALGRDEAT